MKAHSCSSSLTLLYTRLVLWHWVIPPKAAARRSSPSPERYEADSQLPYKPNADTIEEIRAKATDKCFQIIEATVAVIRRFDDQYGPSYFSMLGPQSGIYCVNFLLSNNLHSAHEEELLLQIMQTLVKASKRWQLVKGVTQMLLKVAEEKVKAQDSPILEEDDETSGKAPAPPGQITREVFESMELIVKGMAWSPSDHLHFSSRYPNYLVAKEDTTTELSNMLERWAQLALEEIALREPGPPAVAGDTDIGAGAPPLQSVEQQDTAMVGVEPVDHGEHAVPNESSGIMRGNLPIEDKAVDGGSTTAHDPQHIGNYSTERQAISEHAVQEPPGERVQSDEKVDKNTESAGITSAIDEDRGHGIPGVDDSGPILGKLPQDPPTTQPS